MIKDGECLDDLQNGLFIIQKKDGFKFGIDAVLLADFAKDAKSKNTLDMCSGTGIVALLLSAKTDTRNICALEIQPEMAEMAQRSVVYNSLSDRVRVSAGDVREADKIYGRGAFDKITCNPPYMRLGDGIKNDRDEKSVSRHEILCTLDDAVGTASRLLVSKGRFFMVHRPSRLADIICSMRLYGIEPKRLRFVCPSPSKAPSLLLIEGMKDGGRELKILPTLYIYNGDGTYSEEINKIYGREVE